jgi:hypothetical protein
MAADKTDDAKEVAPVKGVTSVVVNTPFQVCHDGIVHRPDETVEVPETVAAHWIACGWAVAK